MTGTTPPDLAAWEDSGGKALTGWPDQPGLPPPGPVLERAALAVTVLREWAGTWGCAPEVNLAEVLFGRAALMGLSRRGRVSANGTCRLIRADDGWIAVNLARPDDERCVPAVVGRELGDGEDHWAALEEAASRSRAAAMVETAQMLGVPSAALGLRPDRPAAWPVSWAPAGPARGQIGRPRIIDLSAMWAGPLCARLLRDAGAEVVKVESATRLDGARFGPPAFWDRLHAGQEILTIDLESPEGAEHLAELIAGADAVIDSSRPRALASRGIVAEELAGPDLTWISITGYGRYGPAGRKVAFGDDAAVAGGLVGIDGRGEPVFCGDAIADPLSGLVAAAAGARALAEGGGLVSVAMAGVAAWAAS